MAHEDIVTQEESYKQQVERIKTTLGYMRLLEEISLKNEFLTTKEDF